MTRIATSGFDVDWDTLPDLCHFLRARDMPTIVDVKFRPFDVPLREAFGIATGTQLVAANVLVRVELDDGSVGLGEAAPFPAVNAETQADALACAADARLALVGRDATRLRPLAARAAEAVGRSPSALAAVETALLDAFTRRARISLWSFFGGADPELATDITIPTGDAEHCAHLARRASEQGFDTLKIKIGGVLFDTDVGRVRAIHAAAPSARLVLDANASLAADAMLSLLDAIGAARTRVVLLEQPTPASDLDAMRRVSEGTSIPVAADESARSARDVIALARARAASVINVKIMKTGVFEAWNMIQCARSLDLRLMVGGMVETELAMSASACLAAGLGGFDFVDLDTPLFMADRPLRGGFSQTGPRLRVEGIPSGHGVELTEAFRVLEWR